MKIKDVSDGDVVTVENPDQPGRFITGRRASREEAVRWVGEPIPEGFVPFGVSSCVAGHPVTLWMLMPEDKKVTQRGIRLPFGSYVSLN